MLFRSIPCLWITVCLRLCCYVDSAEAQNAKEGKFLKFGLLIPLHLEDILQNERRGVQTSRQTVALLFLRFRCYFFSILINSKGGCILCQMRPVCGDDSAAIPGCLRSTSRCFYARQLNAVERGLDARALLFISPQRQCAIGISSLSR